MPDEGFFLNITKGRGAIFEIELDWKVGERGNDLIDIRLPDIFCKCLQ
jgi:hypothetical protein